MAKKKQKKKRVKTGAVSGADFIAYTDGGCLVNPGGPGGYGVVLVNEATGEVSEFSGGFVSTTNNRMELMAAITALEHIPAGKSVVLYSDSQYFINCFSGKWKRNLNHDLFKRLDAAAKGKTIELRWVRGHAGNRLNERCDNMATAAMHGGNLEVDAGYIPKWQAKPKSERASIQDDGKQRLNAMSVKIEVPDALHSSVEKIDADAYAKKYHVNPACAWAIQEFRTSDHKFKSYTKLKTDGLDFWSSKKLPELLDGLESREEVLRVIEEHFSFERDKTSVLRWYRRGLPLQDCIRKVLVDKEIQQNIR